MNFKKLTFESTMTRDKQILFKLFLYQKYTCLWRDLCE